VLQHVSNCFNRFTEGKLLRSTTLLQIITLLAYKLQVKSSYTEVLVRLFLSIMKVMEVELLSSKYLPEFREIGRKIAYYRTLRGLSQEALADEINISTSYLSKIEAPNSAMTFSLEVLFQIAEALNINIGVFFRPIDLQNTDNKIE